MKPAAARRWKYPPPHCARPAYRPEVVCMLTTFSLISLVIWHVSNLTNAAFRGRSASIGKRPREFPRLRAYELSRPAPIDGAGRRLRAGRGDGFADGEGDRARAGLPRHAE